MTIREAIKAAIREHLHCPDPCGYNDWLTNPNTVDFILRYARGRVWSVDEEFNDLIRKHVSKCDKADLLTCPYPDYRDLVK